MLTVYRRAKDKIVKEKLGGVKSRKNLLIDCFKPSDAELKSLSSFTKIPLSDLKERLVGYERPTTMEDDTFSLIIFGAPVIKKGGTESTSVAIFLAKNENTVILRTEEVEAFDRFIEELTKKNPKHVDSSTLTTRVFMENVIDTYFSHLEIYQEAADKIESTVFKNPQKKSVEETFRIRKSVLLMHKALVANREVLNSIEKGYLSRIRKKQIPEFREMRDDVLQLMDTDETLRTLLTGVLDVYNSAVSNQMNEVIKKLTVVASYVLIPTLIASIYGMNFKVMPEIPWVWGYPFSLGLMVLSIILVYTYFRKAKML